VSFRDLAAKGRGFEAPGSGAESRDASMGRQSGKDGQEVFSTNIWPPLESRVWRPGMVLPDDHFKSCRESPLLELTGRRDMDSSGGILIDILQSGAKKHSRSPNVYGTLDGEPSDFGEVIRSSKTCLNCGAEGHDFESCTQRVDCHKCLISTHFSRRYNECRPRRGCFICGNTGHSQRGGPARLPSV
jgi:hypothetical protein